jgi:hypothetical protein
MKSAKFTQISPSETRLDYEGNKFLLVEQSRGVYGAGRAIQLYLVHGFERKHLKELGWTKSDGSCKGMQDACITRLTNLDECKKAAITYIDNLR